MGNTKNEKQCIIHDVGQRALDWWNKLPMYNMDKPCKRLLAARYYKTEQSFLTDEQIEIIWQQEHNT